MEKKKQKIRNNYSPRKLQEALKLISEGSTVASVSNEFNIPRTTLLYKATGKRPNIITKPGPKCILGDEVEKMLVDWLLDIAKRGFPLSKDGLNFTVKELIKEGHGVNMVKTFNVEKGPGRRWFASFMKRHPILSIRMAEYLQKCRTLATEKSIRLWFNEITELLGIENLKLFNDPKRIYNTDETGVILHPKSLPVIAGRGQRNVYDCSPRGNKDSTTVLITANANGEIAPPMALFSYQRIPTLISAAAPSHWGIGRSLNGWMTSEVFFEYIANVFHKHLINSGAELPIILILDGHKSHLSLPLSKFCSQNNIILIALPPNCTHILQPLDVAFFRPLKAKWKKKLDEYKILNGGKEPRKQDVTMIIDKILQDESFKKSLSNGFKRCGLVPLDPNNVDYTKCIKNQRDPEKDIILDSTSNVEFLVEFEKRMPANIMSQFVNTTTTWIGDTQLSGLYLFWKSIKENEHFTYTPQQDYVEFEFPELDLNNLEDYENVDVINTIAYNDAYNDKDLAVPLSLENLPNLEMATSSSEAFTSFKDLIVPVLMENSSKSFAKAVTNSQENSSSSKDWAASVLLENSLEMVINSSQNSSNLVDSTVQISPENSAEVVINSLENSPGLKDLEAPVLLENSPELATNSLRSSPTSVESKRSVEEILGTVVRFEPEQNVQQKTRENVRKKLKLPSVLTSHEWIELKEAVEDEKKEIEKRKDERKLKKKEAKEKKTKKNKPKVIPAQSKNKRIQKWIKKATNNDEILQPIEITIGSFVVVEWPLNSRTKMKNFVVRIYAIKRGKIFANFLRSVSTREFGGRVFRYPPIADKAQIKFSQIKKLLSEPKIYLRSMYLFDVQPF